MSVVEKIIEKKKKLLRRGAFDVGMPPASKKSGEAFKYSLARAGLSVIAEIKKSSPSAGRLTVAGVGELAEIYAGSPARAISVLTEDEYFGGDPGDIEKVKKLTEKPVLMKDFVIFEKQILFARACGADAVLLIASFLTSDEIFKLNEAARLLGMAAINEVHCSEDIEKLDSSGAQVEIVGVNCRNLRTLEVDPSLHTSLFPLLKKDVVKVAESGIETAVRARQLEKTGYDAILAGESVITSPDPGGKIKELAGVDSS